MRAPIETGIAAKVARPFSSVGRTTVRRGGVGVMVEAIFGGGFAVSAGFLGIAGYASKKGGGMRKVVEVGLC